MAEILVLNGPNLNLLGQREPQHYGSKSLADISASLAPIAQAAGHVLSFYQSNAEHELIQRVHQAMDQKIEFILLNPAMFFEILGKDATLTGRTQIWAGVMRQIAEHPWLGYGYFAVWDDASGWGPLAWIASDARFTPQHAHNSWLEQWLGLGMFGLVAWVLLYLQTAVTTIVSAYRHNGAYLAFPVLLVYSLTTLTESVAVTYNDMRWVIFVCLAVKMALPDPPVLDQATRRAPSATVTTLHPSRTAA